MASSLGGADPINVFAVMEDICDKLKILNYEQLYLRKGSNLKPLSRLYFAIQSKPEQQFPYYSGLVLWLLKSLNMIDSTQEWNEFDDPNIVVASIIEHLKKLGFPLEIKPNKIIHGSGELVVLTLDFLCDKVLQTQRFSVNAPQYVNSDNQLEEAIIDEQADGINDDVDDNEMEAEEDIPLPTNDNSLLPNFGIGTTGFGDDENRSGFYGGGMGIGGTQASSMLGGMSGGAGASTGAGNILESKINPADWKLELERVGPKLKFKSSVASKEWRTHLEQSVKHDKLLKEQFPASKGALEKLNTNLKKAADRINSKERHINKEFEHLGLEFRTKQKSMDAIQEQFNKLNAEITELTNELNIKSDAVENIKNAMNERNNSMTDTTPLKKISSSLNSLKKEISFMELRIGVVGQTLLQSKIKHHHSQHHSALLAAQQRDAAANASSNPLAASASGSTILAAVNASSKPMQQHAYNKQEAFNRAKSKGKDFD